jgi:hypothetical protein
MEGFLAKRKRLTAADYRARRETDERNGYGIPAAQKSLISLTGEVSWVAYEIAVSNFLLAFRQSVGRSTSISCEYSQIEQKYRFDEGCEQTFSRCRAEHLGDIEQLWNLQLDDLSQAKLKNRLDAIACQLQEQGVAAAQPGMHVVDLVYLAEKHGLHDCYFGGSGEPGDWQLAEPPQKRSEQAGL